MRAEPFEIRVPDDVLADVRERLERTRWPEPLEPELAYVRDLLGWWRTDFDWRSREAALNELEQFRAEVDGVRIHFVHERARGEDAVPLLLLHGWPSSFFEYTKILPLLGASFDVVVPSLPGFGFSDALAPGEFRRVPELCVRLMTDVLGYERFGVYGGDIGGMVANRIALERPECVLGLHVSFLAEPYLGPGAPPLSEAEREHVAGRARGAERDGAYAHVQRTRPGLFALPLTDSPAGLAAWIVHFWRVWSDCDGDVERRFTKDELLTTITIYWATGTVRSSSQVYADWKLGSAGNPVAWEDATEVPTGVDSKPLGPDQRIEVPTAVALFSLARWPRKWGERAYGDIRRWTEMPGGGHFGAMEEPELLADELRAFFGGLGSAG